MINNRQGGRRRGRGGSGGGPPRSNNPGPGNRQDNRQRGNAAQLLEKYKGLARDAQMQGDRVQTETFLQYADHYFRVLNESRVRYEEQHRQRSDYADEDEGEDNEGGREAAERDTGEFHAEESDLREAEPRQEREQRPERERPDRETRPDRDDRNGEYRASRPRGRRPAADEESEVESERIALDALPPAIAPASEADEAPARAPRARRPRRPRADDEDVAPAA